MGPGAEVITSNRWARADETYRAEACPRNGIRREGYAKDQRDPRGTGHKDQK